MGITIHYKLKATKTSEQEIKNTLYSLGQIAKKLGFKEISKIWKLDHNKDFNDDEENKLQAPENSESYRWAKIQYQPPSKITKGVDGGRIWSPNRYYNRFWGYIIMCWAGEGCEPTNLGLITKDGKNWLGGAFTKTQYAEHFVKCHLLVIALLDACKKMGILKEVYDEGDYWKKRDLKVLAKNINISTAFIEHISGVLKEKFGDKIVSAVDDCKNIVKIKEGRDKCLSRNC